MWRFALREHRGHLPRQGLPEFLAERPMMLGFFLGLTLGTIGGAFGAAAVLDLHRRDAIKVAERALALLGDEYTAGRNAERRLHGQEPLALPSALREVGL